MSFSAAAIFHAKSERNDSLQGLYFGVILSAYPQIPLCVKNIMVICYAIII